MPGFAWSCPFCARDTTIVDSNVEVGETYLTIKNADGPRCCVTTFIVCPNPACRRFTFTVELGTAKFKQMAGEWEQEEALRSWRLIPQSDAKVFPEYIPEAIRTDYLEANSIKELSPKAAATLARRCLQGMIRDFWGVKKKNLKAAIDAIKGKVDADIWGAIEAVRKVGIIGAHMENDVNLIIDVERNEASRLIALIELLLRQWYIARHERKELTSELVALAEAKRAAKKAPGTV
jgi:hypothetical protein